MIDLLDKSDKQLSAEGWWIYRNLRSDCSLYYLPARQSEESDVHESDTEDSK